MKKMNNQFKVQGNIKWQGLMLSEYIQMLCEWYAEDEHVQKPDFDEFNLQLIQTWRDKQLFKHRGVIECIDVSHRELVYENPFEVERLCLDEIIGITLID